MDADLTLSIQSTKRVTATREAMIELVNAMNVMGGDKDFAQGIFEGLSQQHRTLQQDFMRAFASAMTQYAENNFDLRNEASVEFAKRIVSMEQYFPSV